MDVWIMQIRDPELYKDSVNVFKTQKQARRAAMRSLSQIIDTWRWNEYSWQQFTGFCSGTVVHNPTADEWLKIPMIDLNYDNYGSIWMRDPIERRTIHLYVSPRMVEE